MTLRIRSLLRQAGQQGGRTEAYEFLVNALEEIADKIDSHPATFAMANADNVTIVMDNDANHIVSTPRLPDGFESWGAAEQSDWHDDNSYRLDVGTPAEFLEIILNVMGIPTESA